MPIPDYVPLPQALAAFSTHDGEIDHAKLALAYPNASQSIMSYTKMDPQTGELLIRTPAAVQQQVAQQDQQAAQMASTYRVQTQMDAKTLAAVAQQQATAKQFTLEDMQKALAQQQMALNPPKKG
jgi:hypothetical protein